MTIVIPKFVVTAGPDGLNQLMDLDIDGDLDIHPLAGLKGAFTANLRPGFYPVGDGLYLVEPIPFTVDNNGKINGDSGVELLAVIDGLENLQWNISFDRAYVNGKRLDIPGWAFTAREPGETWRLESLISVKQGPATWIGIGAHGYPVDNVETAADGSSTEFFVKGHSIGTLPPATHIVTFTDGEWPLRNPLAPMAIFLGGESPGDAPADDNMRDGDVWIPQTGDAAPTLEDLGIDGLYAGFDQGRRVAVEYTATTLGAATPGFGGNLLGALVSEEGNGGGGGSGRRGAAGTIRQGGGGGSSGVLLNRVWLPASWFSSTFSVVIGAPGAGGAAVTADDTNGNAGGNGGAVQLLSGANTLQALGGLGGAGGGTGAGGAGGSATSGGVQRPGVAAGGSASATGGVGGDGGSLFGLGSAGGGAGGGITAADVASNGGMGGGNYAVGQSAPSRAGGVVDGTVPQWGFGVAASPSTAGPGGGAASKTAAAQAGGQFVSGTGAYGAGGGGGGASLNTFLSGAGMPGAPGWLNIEWVFG